jgi:hypothetical protein
MRQRRFSSYTNSISILRSALIAGPASLFVPLKLSFENDYLGADMEQIEEQLKRERER